MAVFAGIRRIVLMAAPELAIDGHIEQCKVTLGVGHFQPHTDRPDMFRQQGAFLSDDAALVPRRTGGAKGGECFDGHGFSPVHHAQLSIPRQKPRHDIFRYFILRDEDRLIIVGDGDQPAVEHPMQGSGKREAIAQRVTAAVLYGADMCRLHFRSPPPRYAASGPKWHSDTRKPRAPSGEMQRRGRIAGSGAQALAARRPPPHLANRAMLNRSALPPLALQRL